LILYKKKAIVNILEKTIKRILEFILKVILRAINIIFLLVCYMGIYMSH